MTDAIEFTLPMPPTVNRLYGVGKGGQRYKTKAYKSWCDYAGWSIGILPRRPFKGPYTVHLRLPGASRADVDNCLKPVIDLLVGLGVTDDDRHCVRATAEKIDGPASGTCWVRIEPASNLCGND